VVVQDDRLPEREADRRGPPGVAARHPGEQPQSWQARAVQVRSPAMSVATDVACQKLTPFRTPRLHNSRGVRCFGLKNLHSPLLKKEGM